MSARYGGYAKGFVSGVRPGVPCAHCGGDVATAPFGQALARPAKTPIVKKGEKKKRRPNPSRKSIVSRAVCNSCIRKGLK